MTTSQCEICNISPSKYKCPLCQTQSCSLPCYKSHQTQCRLAEQQTPLANSGTDSMTAQSDSAPEKVAAPDHLVELFKDHPELKQKLRSIYDATQDQGLHTGYERGGSSRFDRGWSEEKGFNRGLALLSKELESSGSDAYDVQAFAAYIKSLARP